MTNNKYNTLTVPAQPSHNTLTITTGANKTHTARPGGSPTSKTLKLTNTHYPAYTHVSCYLLLLWPSASSYTSVVVVNNSLRSLLTTTPSVVVLLLSNNNRWWWYVLLL